MSEQEHNIYSLIFIILFVIASALLIAALIRKLRREKGHRDRNYGIPSQKMCAMIMMIPSLCEFLMNTYYQVFSQFDYAKDLFSQLDNANYWFSILDLLFLIGAVIVYNGYSIQWVIFILQMVQVYTFVPSILNHIAEGITLPLIRFIMSFIYYIISACVMIRVMYPFLFDRRALLSKS